VIVRDIRHPGVVIELPQATLDDALDVSVLHGSPVCDCRPVPNKVPDGRFKVWESK
jgi:hypothetical protein